MKAENQLQKDTDTAAVLARWQADEAAARERAANAGVITPSTMAQYSGLEFLQAIGRGELPRTPIGEVMDFVPVEVERGRMVFQGTPSYTYYNPLGTVHGGWAATLLDSCLGCAVQSTLPRGKGYTTLELKVNYVRAMTGDTGPVRAEGKIIHVGSRVGTAEGQLRDAAGRLYAHATTTCLVFDLPTA